MNYLLDTNACIALINRTSDELRRRLQRAIRSEAQIYVSSAVIFELWYGVAKSRRQAENTERLKAFLAGPLCVLPFDDEDGRVGGSIRAALQASGAAIGAYDLLIAGQALARQLTVVTTNVSEFSRVKGLSWQDWSKPLK